MTTKDTGGSAFPRIEVDDVTPEMTAAGMTEWDKAHREGVRMWPDMLARVFVAMLAARKEES